MASSNDFIICVYEKSLYLRLYEWQDYEYRKFLTEKDVIEIQNIIDKINNFNYTEMNDMGAKLTLLNNQKNSDWHERNELRKQYKKYHDEYQKFGEINHKTENNYTVIFLIAISKKLYVQYPEDMYMFLKSSSIIRDNKKYEITDELILEIFKENPEYYRESLFIDINANIFTFINFYSSMFQKYLDKKIPIKNKHATTPINNINCSESKHGILRGIVHKVNYNGYNGMEPDEYLAMLINSGYLEIQFKTNNPSSGIFTAMLGFDNDLEKTYSFSPEGMFFVFSLSILDDYEYWAGAHSQGSRKKDSFYKGICYECGDELEKYSAAERCYMEMYSDNFNKFFELILASDVNIKRYLEEIIINNEYTYDLVINSEKIPEWVKMITTRTEDKQKVYYKNCKNEIPKTINKNVFNKLIKQVVKRKDMISIPKIDYKGINMRRKIKLLYDPLKSKESKQFPRHINS